MTVSRLGRLLESGEYRRCLEEAQSLLDVGGYGLEEAARIHSAMLRSRVALTDFFAAVEAGELAIQLAEEAEAPDVVGFALVDLGTAYSAIRRYEQAVGAFRRFLSELPMYTAAQCLEGTALQRLANTLQRAGEEGKALVSYWQAHAWFERFGDESSMFECSHALIRCYLDRGHPEKVAPLLEAGDRYVAAHAGNRTAISAHLLNRALFHLVMGSHPESIAEAFQALEYADDRLAQQSQAHLVLCQNAMAQHKPRDAFGFALAARVSAIDGRLYDLEFEASDVLFRLLRECGPSLVKEVEGDYFRLGVDITHYLSDRVIERLSRTN